jgi:Tfp pilus assembly protein PilN
MINILPQKEKEILQAREKKMVILILEILSLVFLLCLALILISMNIYISGQAEVARIILEQEREESEASGVRGLSESIRSANENFSDLESFYKNQVQLTKILGEISRTLPEGVSLKSLSYKRNASQAILIGFAKTREALVEFKENLEQNENFEEVYFPPSCWLKSTEINFDSRFNIKR